ncbi:MAG: hypothetical protein QHJ73_07360 [Armatimonadota bacterium]|nr:hypothetical protein [Armatimonadota bacterium]
MASKPQPADPLREAQAAELLQRARVDLARGDLGAAAARCEEGLRLHPSNAELHATMAEIHYRRGSLATALQEMTEAVRLAPHNLDMERRLRELREEQDRAIEPVIRGLREPAPRPSRSRPLAARRRRNAAGWSRGWNPPEWMPALLLIGGIMLALAWLPRLMGSAMMGISFLIGVLAAVFVYQDARARRMPALVVWLWTAAVFLSRGIGLLVYLLVTRARR